MMRGVILGAIGSGTLLAASAAWAVPLATDKGKAIANHTKQRHMGADVIAVETGANPANVVGRPPYRTFTNEQKTKSRNDIKAGVASFAFEADATLDYNCHGLTFKSNEFWLGVGLLNAADTVGKTPAEIQAMGKKKASDQIQCILDDNGWKALGTTRAAAMVGDAVIYKDAAGNITHSATVTMVDGTGKVTEVRSKFGSGAQGTHKPEDAMGMYGMFSVLEKGTKLKDPPLAPEDLDVFMGLDSPPAKDAFVEHLIDSFVVETNIYPQLVLLDVFDTGGGSEWKYGLYVPEQGLQVDAGDTLALHLPNMLTGGLVSGDAATPAFGSWMVDNVASKSITYEAATSGFLSSGVIGGFTLTSPFAYGGKIGQLVYTESAAGSLGRGMIGPVPEPSAMALLGLAIVISSLAINGVRRRPCADAGWVDQSRPAIRGSG
jgi:hypothetical protein